MRAIILWISLGLIQLCCMGFVYATPHRIISLAPSTTELLASIGVADRLVGVTDNATYPAAVLNLPRIGVYTQPNVAKILSLHPDLIITPANIHCHKQLSALKKAGIPILLIRTHDLATLPQMIVKTGKLFNKEMRARSVAQQLKTELNKMRQRYAHLKKIPVALLLSGPDRVYGVGDKTFSNEVITLCGGYNVMQHINGYFVTDLKQVYQQHPKIILDAVTDKSFIIPAHWHNIKIVRGQFDRILRYSPLISGGIDQVCKIIDTERVKSKTASR